MIAEVLASTKDMDQDQWLQLRRNGIGGSDVAAIAGLNPWKSPVGVYLEKVGQVDSEIQENEAMYWGTTLEEVVAKEFSNRTGLKVQRRNAILRHPEYPFMIANVDRLIVDPDRGRGILECKTASEYMKDHWEEDKVPDYYQLQVQHYLAVTGLPYAFIAVLIGGNKFKYKPIERDEEIVQYLIQIESDFWKLVESKTPPEMDGSDSSSELLNKLYPTSSPGTEIILPDSVRLLIDQYEAYQSEEKAAREGKEEAANKIKALLGDNEIGLVGERKVSWKSVSSSRVDSKLLKEKHPAVYSEVTKTSESRRFTIK